MTYYITGQLEDSELFLSTKQFLIKKGFCYTYPIINDMKLSIVNMVNSDAIIVLEGWQKSKTANIEINLAMQIGMPIYEIKNDEIVKIEIMGRKFDGEKPNWSLLPWDCLKDVAHIFTTGALKYEKDNWKSVPDGYNRYFSAGMRHFTDWFLGEKTDPESGKSHLAHLICCALFLMWKDKHEQFSLTTSGPSENEIKRMKKILG